MTLNIRNLCKLVETFSKMYWARLKEKMEDQAVAEELKAAAKTVVNETDEKLKTITHVDKKAQRRSLSKKPRTTLEVLLDLLQQKIRVNFSNASEAFRFFDIAGKDKISKDHFIFCCAFLAVDHECKDVLELFEVLDDDADGHLDEGEFSMMFEGIDSWNSHNHNIMNSILRDSKMLKFGLKPSGNVDLDLAENTAAKLPYNAHDIHTYPHFFSKKASRIVDSRN